MTRNSPVLAGLVAEFAQTTGRKIRAAQIHRQKNSTEWKAFMASKSGGREDAPAQRPPRREAATITNEERGIAGEVARVEGELVELARLLVENYDDFQTAIVVHKLLDTKRDLLRKLRADLPTIQQDAGDVIEKGVLFRYVQRVRLLLVALPKRIASLLPDCDAATRKRIAAEIDGVLAEAAKIDPHE